MTSSILITDYLGQGTHAARPASPSIPSGGTAVYYETDTTNTFVWTGSAWLQINSGGGTVPTIVQTACLAFSSGANSVVMGSAPTNGNLLVAFCTSIGSMSANTGWSPLFGQNNSGTDYAQAFYKIAGAGESTTQTPIPNTGTGACAIFEVSNGAASVTATIDGSGSSGSFNIVAPRGGSGLLIGSLNPNTSNLPTSITGATAGVTSSVGGRSVATFHASSFSQGNNSVGWAYASSANVKQMGCIVY